MQRGCGFRVKGGIYLCTGLSEDGSPIEDFLVDPPTIIDATKLGLSPIGMKIIKRGDTYHILDWVGSEYYPNVADFIEEARRYGTSRRAPSTLDFSKLGPGSRHLYVHGKAGIVNYPDYRKAISDADESQIMATWAGGRCPKRKHDFFESPDEFSERGKGDQCLGWCWQDIEGGKPSRNFLSDPEWDRPRRVVRVMPSLYYYGYSRPADITPEYTPAIFMSLPITSIQIVKGGNDEKAKEVASKAQLPLLEVEE